MSSLRRNLWILPAVTFILVVAGAIWIPKSSLMGRFFQNPIPGGAYCPSTTEVGSVVWQTDVGGALAGPVVIDSQKVYVGEYNGSNSIVALSKKDGTEAWSTNIYTNVESSLALGSDGTLYAATLRDDTSTPTTSVTTTEGETVASKLVGLIALDASTGTIKAYSDAGVGGQGVDSSPSLSIDGERVYVATVDLRMKYKDQMDTLSPPTYGAYDSSTLEPLIQAESKGWSWSPIISFANGSFLVSSEVTEGEDSGTGVISLYDEEGNELWTKALSAEPDKAGAVQMQGQKTYVILGTHDGNIFKIDLEGNVAWETALGTAGFGGIVIDDENAYLTTTASSTHPMNLVALNLESGEIVWETRMENNASTPAVGQNAVYAVDSDGNLIAFDREDGSELWRVTLSTPVYGYVKIDSTCKTAYVTAENGTVYAVYLGDTAFKSWSQARGSEKGAGHL